MCTGSVIIQCYQIVRWWVLVCLFVWFCISCVIIRKYFFVALWVSSVRDFPLALSLCKHGQIF